MKAFKYFETFSREKPKADFYLSGIGLKEVMKPGIVDRPNGTGDWLFMYFYDPVTIKVDGEIVEYAPGNLMIWPHGAGHYYGNLKQSWKHSWLHCHGSLVAELVKRCDFTPGRPLCLKNPGIFEKYLEMFYHEKPGQYVPDAAILKNIFENMLREIARDSELLSRMSKIPEKLQDSKRFLESNFTRRITLKQLAEQFKMSVPHFCAEFKKYFEVPPIEYLINLRLDYARYLLLDCNLRVEEIAAKVGYDDQFYFSKLFKKKFGSSPRNLRHQLVHNNTE
jgi:AraC-like DNA-binding protein